jgi:hypothetical protein
MPGPGDTQIVANALIERRVQLWIRAYPRRWRERRGEELSGLVVDLAGPDARHLGVPAALDLVRGGWATRWREHPPLHTWLLYRLFDHRIPEAYRSWALDDIDGFWYPIRRSMFFLAFYPAFLYALNVKDPMGPVPPAWQEPAWHYLVGAVAMAVLFLMVFPQAGRDPARRKHVLPRVGEPRVEGALVGWDLPRQRVTARSMLSWVIPLLGITAAASATAVALAPKMLLTYFAWIGPTQGSGPGVSSESVVVPVDGRRVVAVVTLVLALGLGVLGAALARRRLNRLLGERQAQAYRGLRPICFTGKARVLLGIVIIVTLVWLEVSGRIALGASVLMGSVSLLLLPGAAVALLVTRRGDDADLAGADVWLIATRGRLPAVDRPVWGLRPLPAAYVSEVAKGTAHG